MSDHLSKAFEAQRASMDSSGPAVEMTEPSESDTGPDDVFLDGQSRASFVRSVRSDMKKNIASASFRTSAQFNAISDELKRSSFYKTLEDRDTDAWWTRSDYIAYKIENMIAADAYVPFYILGLISLVCCFILSSIWMVLRRAEEDDDAHSRDIWSSTFVTMQVLITGGYDSSIEDKFQRLVFFIMIMTGVLVVSILIGLITDSVNGFMEGLTVGSSKVIEKNHTLILGWNESSSRVLCQIAFLRRVWRIQNERWDRKWLPWRRVPPSTPLAKYPIVILWDGKSKEEMEEVTSNAFAERGVLPHRTKVGRDVVFRRGNPCNAHDLVRVAAHEATSVLITMTERDKEEQDLSLNADGLPTIGNSATLRTLLALRNVIYSHGALPGIGFKEGFRCVVQLQEGCPFIEAAAFVAPDGSQCLYAQDLSVFLNTMMFTCAAQPGLSRVVMNVIDFDGISIRTRNAKQVSAGPNNEAGWMIGKTVGQCLLEHGWADGSVMLGVDDENLNQWDGDSDADRTYNSAGAPGIMSDPSRVVDPTDAIIFLSITSNPQAVASLSRNYTTKTRPMTYHDAAQPVLDDIATKHISRRSIDGSAQEAGLQTSKHILICGWRFVWDRDIGRFKKRVEELSMHLPPGSTVWCLNVHTPEEFKDLMLTGVGAKVGFEAGKGEDAGTYTHKSFQDGTVHIRHFQGDPVRFNDVESLFSSLPADLFFTSAICLGAIVGADLPPHAQDARILSMLMILRQLSSKHKFPYPMHIIAENTEDQTSSLAVVPSASAFKGADKSMEQEPDFINLQAIIARSLVMNLAYPQIQDAMSELLGAKPFTPNITIIPVEKLGVLDRSMQFGTLQHIFQKMYVGRAIALGYLRGAELRLSVPQHEKFTWVAGDRIITIIRRDINESIEDIDRAEGNVFRGKRGSVISAEEAKFKPKKTPVTKKKATLKEEVTGDQKPGTSI